MPSANHSRSEQDAERNRVARLIDGEPSAFSEVYESEKSVVYGFLLRLSANRSVAADLFQNVWMKLAQAAPTLRADSNLRAWLLTVARREYLSFRRAEVVDLSRVMAFGSSADQVSWPEVDLASSELQQALATLADSDREVLLLTALHDLRPEEIAQMLEIDPVAYRKRLSRARRRLAERMAAGTAPCADGESSP